MKKKNIYKESILIAIASLSIVIFGGCRAEDLDCGHVDWDDEEEILISGVIGGAEEVETRANTTLDDINTTYYNCDFIVNMKGQKKQSDGSFLDKSKWSIYRIPSGAKGSLSPYTFSETIDEEENSVFSYPRLNWLARDKEHYFWSWTMSWLPGYDTECKETLKEEDSSLFEDKDFSQGFPIEFKSTHINETTNSSASAWVEDSWQNGKILEQFVAGLKGPLTYIANGPYVKMQYRHMVSKVFFKEFVVVDNVNGTTHSGLKGVLTIYGLPKTATFYPCPVDENGKPKAPYIAYPEDWNYDQTSETTYAITNRQQNYNWDGLTGSSSTREFRDCFYFPPEMDFSKLSFKIEIWEYVSDTKEWRISTSHGNHGAYYGDFSRVSFSRSTTGSGYDNTGDQQGNDKTTLHAGEYMYLYINLYEKGEPSLRASINPWNSWTQRNASHHVEDGIYSREELNEFSSLMSSTTNEETLRRRNEFFETHGAGTTESDPEGEYADYDPERKIIKIYNDIGVETASTSTTSNSSKYNSNSLYVDKEYVLDGQGHTINCTYSYLNTGQVRDVYLRYYYKDTSKLPEVYTEYIIYVDKKGQVWLVDPETYQETDSGYNVTKATKNPFRLDFKTGAIT